MLSIYQSHHLDNLFMQLAQFLGRKQDNPFQPLTILVPSLGIGRWLTYEWARVFGVCVNVNTEFPASFMWECFGKIVPETPKSPILSPQAMHWRLFTALENLPNDEIYQVLHRYLERNPQPLVGRWQLAGRIAEVFGYYRTYRRDWLALWRLGQLVNKPFRHQEWQAALWQQLFAEEHHQQGYLLKQFYRQLKNQPHLLKRLPQRLAIFTTVRLPPHELEFFKVLSLFIDIHFYHFNPSGQYWADSVDEKWLAKMQVKQPTRMALYDKGHPLLTAWGKQHRDTFRLLSQLSGGEQDNDWLDIFPEIPVKHLLAQLQDSIHRLDHIEEATWTIDKNDKSIQIHSCHSLTRQLEVLHDTLLHLFAKEPSLKPQDVVVMLPDIASASGAIEAVFGTVSKQRYIPWQLTGVASVAENSLWRAFEGLYSLSQERFALSAFIDWLSLTPVLTYYALVAEDIERCVILLEKAAVYRSLDGQHRAQITGDNTDTDDVHTFLFGLERLLLATVLPSDYQELYAGIQVVADIEASDFALIGVLCQAVSDIAERRHTWQQRQTAIQGLAQLQADLLKFFVGQVGTRAWESLSKAMDDLQETLNISPIAEPIPLSLLLADLQQRVAASAPGAVPGGVVHFSRLGSLRLLPYKVIAMLGLEDTAFPRREQNNEFDLLNQDDQPRAGDRSRRDDDKAMFLENLMTAEEHLLLFYNGFSHHSATQFPPSSLISQLLDYLSRRVIGGKTEVEKHCCHFHRLQAFSPSYFGAVSDKNLAASFAQEWLPAAQSVLTTSVVPSCFVNTQLTVDESLKQLNLVNLFRFYQHPAKYFLSQQAKLHIQTLQDQHRDEEPLRLDNLAKWQLRHQLVDAQQVSLAQFRASGQLPVGVIGEVYCQQSVRDLQPLKQAIHAYQLDYKKLHYLLAITDEHGKTWQISAHLPPLNIPYQLEYIVSKCRDKHLLNAWLNHLLWQLAGANRPTYWLFLDQAYGFEPIPRLQAEHYVQLYYRYWQQGLQQPLLLSVEAAFAYMAKLNGKQADDATKAALKKWTEQIVDDVYWRQVLPETEREQLPNEFITQAVEVYQPLFTHGKALKWSELTQEISHD